MTQLALIIRHQTRPGLRDEVRKVREAHMAPAVDANPGHVAYACYLRDVEPLLSGPPQVTPLTPVWAKQA